MYNGIKYMCILNDNNLKQKSIEDNVYFTLRDIFLNVEKSDICDQVNYYNGMLTNQIHYEDRTDEFKYVNSMYEIHYVKKISKWLDIITRDWFSFNELKMQPDDPSLYVEFDEWWKQFEETKKTIKDRCDKLTDWEEEDVQHDCEIQYELSDIDIDLTVD